MARATCSLTPALMRPQVRHSIILLGVPIPGVIVSSMSDRPRDGPGRKARGRDLRANAGVASEQMRAWPFHLARCPRPGGDALRGAAPAPGRDLVVLIQEIVDDKAVTRFQSDEAIGWRHLDPATFLMQSLEACGVVRDYHASQLATLFIHKADILFLLTLINSDEQHQRSPFRDLETCVHRRRLTVAALLQHSGCDVLSADPVSPPGRLSRPGTRSAGPGRSLIPGLLPMELMCGHSTPPFYPIGGLSESIH